MKKIYYFAFGSNMDQEQMKERCPDARVLKKVVLKNYKIAFTIFSPKRLCGCADILKSIGDEVWGILYEITEKDLETLDQIEMHPIKYKRFTTYVEDEFGKKYKVETYEVASKEGEFLKPSEHYLGLMIKASRTFNFPKAYSSKLKETEMIAV